MVVSGIILDKISIYIIILVKHQQLLVLKNKSNSFKEQHSKRVCVRQGRENLGVFKYCCSTVYYIIYNSSCLGCCLSDQLQSLSDWFL